MTKRILNKKSGLNAHGAQVIYYVNFLERMFKRIDRKLEAADAKILLIRGYDEELSAKIRGIVSEIREMTVNYGNIKEAMLFEVTKETHRKPIMTAGAGDKDEKKERKNLGYG